MKALLLILLLCCQLIHSLSKSETKDLSELAKNLYEVEDKLDHLLFHFNHDLTRKAYKKTRYGTKVREQPKNPNSIHQKLKMIDNLSAGAGSLGRWKMSPGAYNEMLGGPALAIPAQYAH